MEENFNAVWEYKTSSYREARIDRYEDYLKDVDKEYIKAFVDATGDRDPRRIYEAAISDGALLVQENYETGRRPAAWIGPAINNPEFWK